MTPDNRQTGQAAPDRSANSQVGLTRRTFLTSVGATVGGLHLPAVAQAQTAQTAAQTQAQASPAAPAAPAASAGSTVKVKVNGRDHSLNLDPRTSLLDALREQLHLTGTKKGCDHGQCGACTVHVNGRRVNACLTLAATLDGDEVTTIEGLGSPDNLHPLQQAFVDHDAYQCGYCTAGQIMSGAALMREPCGRSDADVREAMSGNICRCGAYGNIVAAIQIVRSN